MNRQRFCYPFQCIKRWAVRGWLITHPRDSDEGNIRGSGQLSHAHAFILQHFFYLQSYHEMHCTNILSLTGIDKNVTTLMWLLICYRMIGGENEQHKNRFR